MNEFKFSCPNCQQNIQATPEYSGMQITCPTCHGTIVVPQAPASAARGAPAAPEAPGTPASSSIGSAPAGITIPRGTKLTMAASTVEKEVTSPVMATTMVRKAKKPKIGLYVGLGVGAVAVIVAAILTPKAIDKYHQHQDEVKAAEEAKKAAEEAAKAPPELAVDDILSKVDETYKGMTSYSAQGESVETLDMSKINALLKDPQTIKSKLSILLSRPNLYRLEWEREMGAKTLKGAIWSAGKGDYILTGATPRKVKSRDAAVGIASGTSGSMSAGIIEYFFDTKDTLPAMLKNASKQANETLNGRKCYVISGQAANQDMKIWVHQDDFLIAQAEMTLGGKLDNSMMAGTTAAQKKQADYMSKIKGNIIDTYDGFETNKVLNPEAFQAANTPTGVVRRKAAGEGRRKKPGEDRSQ